MYLNKVTADKIYQFIISTKTRLPTGLLHWREEIDHSDAETDIAFTFAKLCSKRTFDRAFQYKIITNILPTNKYHAHYQVRDSDLCCKCLAVPETVTHHMWSCPLVIPYLAKIKNFLRFD